ncbi:unnamed protein product, partial [Phaeothamnion confervicola]
GDDGGSGGGDSKRNTPSPRSTASSGLGNFGSGAGAGALFPAADSDAAARKGRRGNDAGTGSGGHGTVGRGVPNGLTKPGSANCAAGGGAKAATAGVAPSCPRTKAADEAPGAARASPAAAAALAAGSVAAAGATPAENVGAEATGQQDAATEWTRRVVRKVGRDHFVRLLDSLQNCIDADPPPPQIRYPQLLRNALQDSLPERCHQTIAALLGGGGGRLVMAEERSY